MAGLEIPRKRELHLWRWAFALLLAAVLAASGWFGYRWYVAGEEPPFVQIAGANPQIDESDVSQEKIDSYVVPASQPRYISIPKLGVDKVRVLKVGITSTNQLDVPKNINDSAWYEKSATPGQGYGAVLIDGHNGGISKDGVFAGLKSLEVGDKITIERGDGKKFTYSVVENQSMPLEEVLKTGMKKMMMSVEPDKEGLNLITCDGKWVPRYQEFDRRIMLRAVLVGG